MEPSMDKKPTLAENRETLRNQIETYRSLPEYVLDGAGAVITRSKLARNASTQENEGFPSYWINGIVLTVLTFLVGWSISLLLHEEPAADELRFMLWASAMGALSLI